ncbi:unnamed protein product [Chondrus crispus]|uniref:Uncharacterized protein n=1 Tax=Chondrus crispus TaxID=2769 RepID=R7QPC4_CHOCR|nr:unnamed protein product [Chondrus crispus]CDF39336.1 unnamed protein product [Chondrus crispus]|eukprot:XP_005719247.1 unnamed protein product [Chondrus crispus]
MVPRGALLAVQPKRRTFLTTRRCFICLLCRQFGSFSATRKNVAKTKHQLRVNLTSPWMLWKSEKGQGKASRDLFTLTGRRSSACTRSGHAPSATASRPSFEVSGASRPSV